MELLTDWKFWGLLITVLGLLVNWLASHKIANNHLFHIDEKLDEIKITQSLQHKEIQKEFKEVKKEINLNRLDITTLKEKTKNL